MWLLLIRADVWNFHNSNTIVFISYILFSLKIKFVWKTLLLLIVPSFGVSSIYLISKCFDDVFVDDSDGAEEEDLFVLIRWDNETLDYGLQRMNWEVLPRYSSFNFRTLRKKQMNVKCLPHHKQDEAHAHHTTIINNLSSGQHIFIPHAIITLSLSLHTGEMATCVIIQSPPCVERIWTRKNTT